MLNVKEFHHLPLLNSLLRDSNLNVRVAAIHVVVHWKVNETVPVLIDLLSSPVYAHAALALWKDLKMHSTGRGLKILSS